MSTDELYYELVQYVCRKFASRPAIALMSEDIVGDVFLDFYEKNGMGSDKENFGYLSKSCIRRAYKVFKALDTDKFKTLSLESSLYFLSEADVVDEIIQSADTKAVLDSLEILKAVEKVVIKGRYYGELKFSKIAEELGLNLKTVISHHRRALEKLRPHLSKHL